jgi:hypothetical protein
MRMRHAIGRIDLRELDVGALRKGRVALERPAERARTARRRAAGRAPRIADCPPTGRRRARGSPATSRSTTRRSCGCPIDARKTKRGSARSTSVSGRRPGIGLDRDLRALGITCDGCASRSNHDGGKAAEAVARELRRAAVGIEEAHAGALGRRLVDDEAVGPGAAVAVAEAPRERGEIGATHLVLRDVEEVVAVGVGLDE